MYSIWMKWHWLIVIYWKNNDHIMWFSVCKVQRKKERWSGNLAGNRIQTIFAFEMVLAARNSFVEHNKFWLNICHIESLKINKDCENHIARSMHGDPSVNHPFCSSLRRDNCIWIHQEGRVWLSDLVALSLKTWCKWTYLEMPGGIELKELVLQVITLCLLLMICF